MGGVKRPRIFPFPNQSRLPLFPLKSSCFVKIIFSSEPLGLDESTVHEM